MSRASLSSTLRRASALLVLGAAGLGCGGLGPGDYVFYRVAFSQQQKKSPGCFGSRTASPPNEKFDKTNFRASSLFHHLRRDGGAGEDKLYLDMGAVMVDDDGMAGDDEGRAITVEGYEEAGSSRSPAARPTSTSPRSTAAATSTRPRPSSSSS
jgi:hypothetical protein